MTTETEKRWLTVSQIATLWNVSYKAAHSQLHRQGADRRVIEGVEGKKIVQYLYDPEMPTHFREGTKERGFHMGLTLEERIERTSRIQQRAAEKAARLIAQAQRKAEKAKPTPSINASRIEQMEETIETAKAAIDWIVEELVKLHDRIDSLNQQQQFNPPNIPWTVRSRNGVGK
jgi:hypothetical protein